MLDLLKRPRRNRKSPAIRSLCQETQLLPSDLVIPFFLIPGKGEKEPIHSLPGIERLSMDLIAKEAEKLHALGVQAIALFPQIDPSLKDDGGSEAYNPNGLIAQAIRFLKQELPSLALIADVALDPYTSHGHDGIAIGEEIDNDATIEILIRQALVQAEAGIDIIAPSDMMDGRIGEIRRALDGEGFSGTSLLSYAAKYSSSLYYPFRDAIKTKLSFGDKKTYQLNPANKREAVMEAKLDEAEGADMLLVKPASLYLDVIADIKKETHLPVGAYHVSGEYAMVMAADKLGYLHAPDVFRETLLSIKRAGADFIFTYAYKFIRSL